MMPKFFAKKRAENGMASIVVISILIILISLVSVGFAVVMNRAARNALNNQLSAAAGYAAQSGINDAINYLQNNPNASATTCSDLAGTPPFTNSNLSGDGKTAYSCVLVNPNPGSLGYQAVPSGSSEVIKATTVAQAQEFMFSWQLSGGGGGQPGSNPGPGGPGGPGGGQPRVVSGSLPDQTTWNANKYTPLLRVTLYPIPSDGSLSNTQSASKTFFFYPTSSSANTTEINYTSAPDGSVNAVNCGASLNVNGFTTDSYDCHAGINGLNSAMSGLSYFYLRITPIYNQADILVQAKDNAGKSDKFQNAQTDIDVTGRSGNAVKRLDARVSTIGTNPTDNSLPEYALRSANAICKRLNVVDPNVGPINIDSAYSSCGNIPCPPSDTVDCPQPTVSLTPHTSSVSQGNSQTLSWTSTNTSSCAATSPSGWTASKATSGNQSVTPGSTTTYTITCTGKYGGSASDSATVTVTPATCTPTIQSFTADSYSVPANSSDTLHWRTCGMTQCFGSNNPADATNPADNFIWYGGNSVNGDVAVVMAKSGTFYIHCSADNGVSYPYLSGIGITVTPGYPPIQITFHPGDLYTISECKYQWRGTNPLFTYSPWPYDYWWCKHPTKDNYPCFQSSPCYDIMPNDVNTTYYLNNGRYYQAESFFDLPLSGYPAYCPGHAGNWKDPTIKPKDCDVQLYSSRPSTTLVFQTANHCADGTHQYTSCQGYYTVSGGYNYSVSCYVTDNLYGSTFWTSNGFDTTPYTVEPLNAGWGGSTALRTNSNVTLASIVPPGGGSGGVGGGGPTPPSGLKVVCTDAQGNTASTPYTAFGATSSN